MPSNQDTSPFPSRSKRLTWRLCLGAGVLAATSCGASDRFIDLFPDLDGGTEGNTGDAGDPTVSHEQSSGLGSDASAAATSAVDTSAPVFSTPVFSTSVWSSAPTASPGGSSLDSSSHDPSRPSGETSASLDVTSSSQAARSTEDTSSGDVTFVDVESNNEIPTLGDRTSETEDAAVGPDAALPVEISTDVSHVSETSETSIHDGGTDSSSEHSSNGVSAAVSATEALPSTGEVPSTEPLPGSCGDGNLHPGEECCTTDVVTAELDVRSAAAAVALDATNTCSPRQSGSTEGGRRLTYEYCVGTCEDGNTGCDTTMVNTEIIYEPATRTVYGVTDVTVSGTLNWRYPLSRGSCEAIVTLPEVEFMAQVNWSDDPLQVMVVVTNLEVDVVDAQVTGCFPRRPPSRAVEDMDLAALVTPIISGALDEEFAGLLSCPY